VEAYSHYGSIKGGLSYYRAAFRGLWSRADGTVPAVSVPVTVIWGDRDRYLLPTAGHVDITKATNLKGVQRLTEVSEYEGLTNTCMMVFTNVGNSYHPAWVALFYFLVRSLSA
jgi:hypothetical protein